ncbi:hypothetical protein A2630_04450 [Candidatus Woesebacteria bacterium RIFCSPHIGHO2_01_FULL_44_10]|uniref:Glycosyl transferase family 1 domain-containing protein n=1 Tax=Candidatus Woesebacteria bacterium RIFCSPLOWO2_01_FULL_44_14 TaxID=1802525 RepID=A0A1F8C384_9BACT|nr:MAG: hypothetical protein A2630_04450 [Candidatus Woesebacteria bacterium RIFCSPHIGHO2_01_FULL_44_10]OGM56030.1 MAG: hypothetical protein A3F62_03875 [Candidatus Woesebacteria bacterium RIFCSPHIGHO2_12_FULL_44_11]OGM70753.1 MAG: hypothetical protein A2975_02585 [Candidatus Woesebacteria bacterium RIFCSPLOWO2_01_FULL_44_14]
MKKPYFLYVGNAYPHKNLQRAAEAALAARQTLFIASSRNIFTERLEKMIRELRAQDYVKLLGFVPDDKLAALYRNAIAFVCPSTYEGFGLPGLEAMAAGTLVLASNIPVFKEIYQDHALYFNPYDFSAIAAAMKDALEMSPSTRTVHIKAAQKFVRRYSWSQMAKQTLKVYNEA